MREVSEVHMCRIVSFTSLKCIVPNEGTSKQHLKGVSHTKVLILSSTTCSFMIKALTLISIHKVDVHALNLIF